MLLRHDRATKITIGRQYRHFPTCHSKSMRETSCAQVRRRGFWQFVVFGKQMMRDRPKQAASTAQAELALTLTRNSKYAAQIREAWALKPRFPNLQVKVF